MPELDTATADGRDPLDLLAEQFAARCRRGERPDVESFVSLYPELAGELRELLPQVARLEELKQARQGDAPPVAAPERLGDYRIVREVGRGGMGIVYEAEQVSLGRRVAVKVLPRHCLLDPRKLGRFRREAQAAARLHHTNIVPVFGVGEADGLHYYVMQLIDGRGLNEVLEELRRSGSLPGLAQARRAAGMALQAAEALAYAHAQGTLHRDVKPANLLLDAKDTVWVADFGLAKATGQADLTDTGDVVGTLCYLAPEVLEGRGDARSDVYSLGLTLYELLTLRSPFGGACPAELLQRVTTTDPPRPRALNPAIPHDLETIVLKATTRDPAQRYASAAALADDLRRFLDDRPIRARRITLVERGWRWCRRNRAVAVLASVALLCLVIAAASGWVGYVRTSSALEGQATKTKEAEDATRQAQANVELSLEQFEDLFEQLARRDGPPVPGFRGPGELGGRRGPGGPGGPPRPAFDSPDDAALLQSVLTFYERFAEKNETTRPRLQREVARAYRRVAEIRQRLGEFPQAEAACRRAVALAETLLAATPEDGELRRLLAEACAVTDVRGLQKEEYGDARRRLEKGLAAAEQLDGVPRADVALIQGRLHYALGGILQAEKHSAAETEYGEAIRLYQDAARNEGARFTLDLAGARHALARLLLQGKHADEARRLLLDSIADLDNPPNAGRGPGRGGPPTASLLALHYETLAEAYEALGDTSSATQAASKAAEYTRGSRGPGGPLGSGPPGRRGP